MQPPIVSELQLQLNAQQQELTKLKKNQQRSQNLKRHFVQGLVSQMMWNNGGLNNGSSTGGSNNGGSNPLLPALVGSFFENATPAITLDGND